MKLYMNLWRFRIHFNFLYTQEHEELYFRFKFSYRQGSAEHPRELFSVKWASQSNFFTDKYGDKALPLQYAKISVRGRPLYLFRYGSDHAQAPAQA
jgi:hypothetical protein